MFPTLQLQDDHIKAIDEDISEETEPPSPPIAPPRTRIGSAPTSYSTSTWGGPPTTAVVPPEPTSKSESVSPNLDSSSKFDADTIVEENETELNEARR